MEVFSTVQNPLTEELQENPINTEYSEEFKSPNMNTVPVRSKRPPVSSTSSDYSRNSNISNNRQVNKIVNTPKKPKTNIKITPTCENIAIDLEPAKSHITQNSDKYPLNFDEITNFLVKTYDNPNIPEVALTFTSNLSSLIEMLKNIRELIAVTNLKSRIYRIIRKLNHENDSSSDSEFINN